MLPYRGMALGQCAARHRHQEFIRFLLADADIHYGRIAVFQLSALDLEDAERFHE